MEDTDVQLQLKKRARRRLVGAVAFVSVVAVALPMVMDHEPRQPVQDVEIRIPGQDEKPFAPKFAVAPVEKTPVKVPEAKQPAPPSSENRVEAVKEKPVEKLPEKVLEKPLAKPEKAPEKVPEKSAAKNEADAKRAAAILAGQGGAPISLAPTAAKTAEYVVLIGAFTNEANVKNLKSKLTEQNIKTFSEPLDTPQGKKTRVRAGPFPNREAAEKALEKMQRIGVSGVVSAK